MSKPLHSAHAAETGVMAAMAASKGVTGALDVLEGNAGMGAAMSDSADWDKATEGLGEIYNIKTENKLRYLYAKQPFTIGIDNNINCYSSSKQDLDRKYAIIEKNLNRYSKSFLKKINLKYIVLCEDLSISGIGTAGIPDNIMKTLILDIKFNEKYFERVIHHEVFHIIHNRFKNIFNEKVWSNFNDKTFEYAECSTCSDRLGLDLYVKTNGFLTEYSKSVASEDMAEVFSFLMTDEAKIKNIATKDSILFNKIEFIKNGIKKIENFKL